WTVAGAPHRRGADADEQRCLRTRGLQAAKGRIHAQPERLERPDAEERVATREHERDRGSRPVTDLDVHRARLQTPRRAIASVTAKSPGRVVAPIRRASDRGTIVCVAPVSTRKRAVACRRAKMHASTYTWPMACG